MILHCKHCGRDWDYKGKAKYYACCPACKNQVKIPKEFGGLVGELRGRPPKHIKITRRDQIRGRKNVEGRE